jgi:hypothetical protein
MGDLLRQWKIGVIGRAPPRYQRLVEAGPPQVVGIAEMVRYIRGVTARTLQRDLTPEKLPRVSGTSKLLSHGSINLAA